MAVVVAAFLAFSNASIARELTDEEKAAHWTSQVERGKAVACYNLGKEVGTIIPRSGSILYLEKVLALLEKHCKTKSPKEK